MGPSAVVAHHLVDQAPSSFELCLRRDFSNVILWLWVIATKVFAGVDRARDEMDN